ncbi:MAG: carbohydrate binding domain-containing protein [Acidobacteria bacterium]|nr:carbohydrate binding domain-containing protein [Acidobacteriota bacterium]
MTTVSVMVRAPAHCAGYRALLLLAIAVAPAASQCNIQVKPSSDYASLIASIPDGSPPSSYRWLRNGQAIQSGANPQSFLLHGDGSLVSSESISPTASGATSFAPGKWGQAIAIPSIGALAYPRAGAVDFTRGTIEMWIAPKLDGNDPAYSARGHVLFGYTAANGDTFNILESGTGNILNAAGVVAGQYQSAYNWQTASMLGWKAGEWHHAAATFSVTGNFLRFYLDGVLAGDTNEKRYVAPTATGATFQLGDPSYLIDEVRISRETLPPSQILADATRTDPLRNGEVWLSLANLAPGDQLVLESGGCSSAPFVYNGLPVRDPDPVSTLLPPNSTSVAFTVSTASPSSCRYAVNVPTAYENMSPFTNGAGSTIHQTTVGGLSPDTTRVNDVYVRCALAPDYALRMRYRSLPVPKGSFPRLSNLWGWDLLNPDNRTYATKLQLFVPGGMSTAQLASLRALNPNLLILTSLQPVEYFNGEPPIPENYYLHDTSGKRISMWPNSYRLNLTRPEVAEFRARSTYQSMVDGGLFFDGCFFDSFGLSVSQTRTDAYGNAIQIDADGDGKPDAPQVLDAAWQAGMLHLMDTWPKLMPYAYATGHFDDQALPAMGASLNGDNIAFLPDFVAEGTRPFDELWTRYQSWWSNGRPPLITNVDMSAHYQMGYGYGVYSSFQEALQKIPARVLDFARTYYPFMRFGLATALMNDGYFERHFSDVLYCVPWWYDEFGLDLGQPLGPYENAFSDGTPSPSVLQNGSFEAPLPGSWQLFVDKPSGAVATAAPDGDSADGQFSVRIRVTDPGDKVIYHVNFYQEQLSVKAGTTYDLAFSAKADKARPLTVYLQRRAGDWENLGIWRDINLNTAWTEYKFSFGATGTRSDAGLQFFLAADSGEIWLDNVRLTERPPQVFRRYFENGAALVNGTPRRQTIAMPSGYKRFTSDQAPRYQYIVDDAGPALTLSGTWKESVYDTAAWKVDPPFYHNWGKSCHESSDPAAVAEWDLGIAADGVYTIQAWWAAAPPQSGWSKSVTYEVVSGDRVLASAILDQTANGDNWNPIAKVTLSAADKPVLRIRNGTQQPMIADAIHIFSEGRYNDGSDASTVTLEPFDGVVLQRKAAESIYSIPRPRQ